MYTFINTHATQTVSVADNSGAGITYKARGRVDFRAEVGRGGVRVAGGSSWFWSSCESSALHLYAKRRYLEGPELVSLRCQMGNPGREEIMLKLIEVAIAHGSAGLDIWTELLFHLQVYANLWEQRIFVPALFGSV